MDNSLLKTLLAVEHCRTDVVETVFASASRSKTTLAHGTDDFYEKLNVVYVCSFVGIEELGASVSLFAMVQFVREQELAVAIRASGKSIRTLCG